MLKRGMALLLTAILLLGMMSVTVLATGEDICTACYQHKTVQEKWIGGKTEIGQQLLSGGVNVALEFPNNPPAYVDTADEKAAWIADQCRAKGITDPWQIALWLHDWLIYNANYDYTFTRYTADGVLLYGTGVCDSYARAYNLLLQQFGIESIRLSSDEMNHAWNLVKIDGQWCHIDATWDDPGEGGHENHGYFGLTDELMDYDHDWDRSYPGYPAATSLINYYPIRMGLGFTTEQEMYDLLVKHSGEKKEVIQLFYLGDDPDFAFYNVLYSWCMQAYSQKLITSCKYSPGEKDITVYLTYPASSGGVHSHKYDAYVTYPTCTQKGYTTYICSCNDYYVDDYTDPLGHNWADADCDTPKTCDRCGETEGKSLGHNWADADCDTPKTCERCGATSGSALGHNWKDATCTTAKTCKTCGATSGNALGHNWKDATCTTAKTCKTCGATSGSALGHSWVDATCTTAKTCKTCGVTEGNALGHSWKDATCTAAKTCKTCGATEGEALGHDWVDATCVAPKTCPVCGETEGEALDHTEEEIPAVPATCTATGLTAGVKCAVCKNVLKEQKVVAALGHTEAIDAAVPATCTETGLTQGKHCTVCGAVTVPQQIVTATGHKDLDQNYTCDVCGEELCTDHVEELNPGKDATCTETGLTAGKKCALCGDIIAPQTVIPPMGHTPVADAAVEATCTKTGLTAGAHCVVCEVTIKAQQTIPAKGHTEVVDKAVAATCTTAGKTEGKHCSVCGAVTKAQQTVPAKGHTEVTDKAVAATCTTAGKTEGKHCSVCGTVTVAQQAISAKGHTAVLDAAVAATCTKSGKTSGSHCSICGTVIMAQVEIPATGHNWKDATCTTAKTCKTCGATSGNALGHSWAAGNCTTPKTCKTCGVTTGGVVHAYESKYDYKCDLCGDTRPVDMTRPMVDMFRMYDPNSGEHFYTGSMEERENLVAVGWQYEGVGFTFPLTTGKPVHRLYDPATGEHLYTMDEDEMNMLLASGWNYEGIAFNSGFENEVPQYRLHNPNATRGAYHFTASIEERDMLISLGWEYQGIGWYSLGA